MKRGIARGTGTDESYGRAETHDGPVRFNAGDCRIDHSRDTARAGAGY